jgi:hypothetical protein
MNARQLLGILGIVTATACGAVYVAREDTLANQRNDIARAQQQPSPITADDLPDFIAAAACRSHYYAIGYMQTVRGDQAQGNDNLVRARALDQQWEHIKGYRIARENSDVNMKSAGDQLPEMLGRLGSACRRLGLPQARV